MTLINKSIIAFFALFLFTVINTAYGTGAVIFEEDFDSKTVGEYTDAAWVTGSGLAYSNARYLVAEDADDFWDYVFPVGGIILQLDGSGKNVHTGTQTGGVQVSGRPLGSTGNVEREWSAWQNWAGANGNWAATTEAELVGISQQLQIIPEPATMALLGLGGLAMLRRRRRS